MDRVNKSNMLVDPIAGSTTTSTRQKFDSIFLQPKPLIPGKWSDLAAGVGVGRQSTSHLKFILDQSPLGRYKEGDIFSFSFLDWCYSFFPDDKLKNILETTSET